MSRRAKVVLSRSLLSIALIGVFAGLSTNVLAAAILVPDCSALPGTPAVPTPYLAAPITSGTIATTALRANECVNLTGPSQPGVDVKNTAGSLSIAAISMPNQLYVVTTGGGSYGFYVGGGGSVAAHSVDIYNSGPSSFGAYVVANSTFTSDGTVKIDSTGGGNNTTGLSSEGTGASIQLNNVSITTGGINSSGMRTHLSGSIHISGTTFVDTSLGGSNAFGLAANGLGGAGAMPSITLDGSARIITGGNGSSGLNSQQGLITINSDININTYAAAGTATYGAFVSNGGVINLNGGGAGTTTPTNIIATGGNNSDGLHAESGGIINITGASSTTAGVYTTDIDTSNSGIDTIGIHATDVGTKINIGNSVEIMTDGTGSYGVEVNAGGVVNFSDIASIATGLNMSADSIGVYAIDAGSKVIFAKDISIETDGQKSYGMYAENGGTITNLSGTASINNIDTTTDTKIGLFANGAGSSIDLNNAKIITRGVASSGIRAEAGGVISIQGTASIDTSGTSNNTYGINALGAGSVVNLNGSSNNILTGGDNSDALFAETGGVINVNGPASPTPGVFTTHIDTTSSGNYTIGLHVNGIGSSINFNNYGSVEIISRGLGSSGMRAENGGVITIQGVTSVDTSGISNDTFGVHAMGAGSVVNLNGSSNRILTGGDNSDALLADTGGVIYVGGAASSTLGAFTTHIDTSSSGNDTIGIHVDGVGSSINFINGGSVEIISRGSNSSGMLADNGGVINIQGETSVDTSGISSNTYGAHAMGAGSAINLSGKHNNILTGGNYSDALFAEAGGVITVSGVASNISGGFTTHIDTSSSGDNTIGIHADGVGSLVDFINGGSVEVISRGSGSSAIRAANGGVIRIQGLTSIDSSGTGNNTYGAHASGAGSIISLNGSTNKIVTGGYGSDGLLAEAGGVINVTGAINIDTKTASGNNTIGAYASGAGSIINLNNMIINTGGDHSHGLAVDGGGIVFANGTINITTTGNNSVGVLVDDTVADSGVTLNPTSNNNTITTSGANSFGIEEINDSSTRAEIISNLKVITSGVGSDALYIDPDQQAITTNITNTNFTAQQGNGIGLIGGNRTFNLVSSSITSVASYSINATQNTNLTINLKDSSLLSGAIIQDATSTANLNVDSSSTWVYQMDSTLQQITNAGTITSTDANLGVPNSTLTILGNYISNDGLLKLNARLADDNSITDFVLVKGSTSGTSGLMVNNVNGPGAQTVNGIKVIQVDGASSGLFTLRGRAVAGPYEYYLYQGTPTVADGNWYLRSEYEKVKNVLRPVIGAYLANQDAANGMFVHSLHDRLGESMYASDLCNCKDLNGSAWARIGGYHQKGGAASGEIDINSNVSLLQAGVDLIKWRSNKSRIQGGIMFDAGQSNSQSRTKLNSIRAEGKLNAYALGIYGTWYGAGNERNEGPYIDSWLQYGSFSNTAKSPDIADTSYDSHNWQVSLEGGYALALSETPTNLWYIEPQAQIIYTDYSQDKVHEYNGSLIKEGNTSNWTSRIGGRLYARLHLNNGMKLKPFVEANWLHDQHSSLVDMSTSYIEGAYTSDLPADKGELKFGVEAELAKHWNVWGHMGYQTGSHSYSQISGNLGMKYLW